MVVNKVKMTIWIKFARIYFTTWNTRKFLVNLEGTLYFYIMLTCTPYLGIVPLLPRNGALPHVMFKGTNDVTLDKDYKSFCFLKNNLLTNEFFNETFCNLL
jgi:hypothetical protein